MHHYQVDSQANVTNFPIYPASVWIAVLPDRQQCLVVPVVMIPYAVFSVIVTGYAVRT